ncbi:MAG: oxidoreductase [Anaerolineaceae bacterium]|nr:oxidoreductase [Anaerolineaceae bacterium]
MSDNWTTDNIPDLKGKVIIVTGANCGIGFEEAKEFARKGAQIIMACRSMEKAKAALAKIQAEVPEAQIEIMKLDLTSQASIHQFANEFKAKHDRLDVLVNNAGIMLAPYSKTEDSFESQFATNHLGHFVLTGLLLDVILYTPNSRVVNVSSMGHRFGTIDFDNLMYEDGKDYSPARAYGRSKLANLLFTYELQRRFEAFRTDAIAVAAHPGSSDTNLSRYIEDRWYIKLLAPLMKRMAQSAAMGALPTIRAAVDPDVKGGQYYGPRGFMEQKGPPVIVQSNSASHDEVVARRLWEVSEKLTGVYYTQLDNL